MKRVLDPRYSETEKTKILTKTNDIFTLLLVFISIISISVYVYVSSVVKKYSDELPSKEIIESRVTDSSANSYLYDINGKLIYIFSDPNRDRDYVEFKDIPNEFKIAALAAEDEDFYNHSGIDYQSIFRGLFLYIFSNGEEKIGGSTISQQLVKNTILNDEKTFERKIKEMIVTLMIESDYSKDQILELYLNSIQFGGRIEGIKSASRAYFNKELKDVNQKEAIFLISLIQSPSIYSPIFSDDQEKSWEYTNARIEYTYQQILENYLKLNEYFGSELSTESIEDSRNSTVQLLPNLGDIKAPHYVFYIKDILKDAPYNISENDLYNGGYKITTTLDLDMQEKSQRVLQEGLIKYSKYGMENGAYVAIDPQNGHLLSMVGSKDYWGKKDVDGKFDPQVNVTLSSRNLGSSIKPFLVYNAFQRKLYSEYSIIYDSPLNIDGYSPKNSDNTFMGPISVRTALINSRNIPFVRMLQKVGVENFLDTLHLVGYKDAINKNKYGLSIALGGFESNLLEHTHAYSVFANNGDIVDLMPIKRIENEHGNVFFEANVKHNVVFDEKNVGEINNILSEYGPDGIYGKTGTTDSNKDTYFIGYNDIFVAGVWTGNNNNAEMSDNAFGSTTALPIWVMIYNEIVKDGV